MNNQFVQAALVATVAALNANTYEVTYNQTFIDADTGVYTGAMNVLNQVKTSANGYQMDAFFRHYQAPDDTYMLQVCLNLKVPITTNNRMYYWGLNFRPQEPITESNWDGLIFQVPFTTAAFTTARIENYDTWYSQAGGLVDTNINGPKTNYLVRDKTQNWAQDPDKSRVTCTNYFNGTTTNYICKFEGCAERKFRTEDTQDWQINTSYMQTFQMQTFYSTYQNVTTGTVTTDTMQAEKGMSGIFLVQMNALQLTAAAFGIVSSLILL